MDEWYTVRQAATDLEVTPSRVYALMNNGTLSWKLQGLTRMVSRRSVQLYKDSPNRDKFAGGNLRRIADDSQAGLFDPEQPPLKYDGDDLPPAGNLMLSDQARRLYDADRAAGRFPAVTRAGARGEG